MIYCSGGVMAEAIMPSVGVAQKVTGRKTVELLRGIGVFGAMVFGIHCISLSSSGLLPFSSVAGLWPGANLVGVLTIAMFFCLFHAYTYAIIGSAVPKSGADYLLSSRTLNPILAFAASWTLVIFSALVAGSLIAVIPQGTIPTFLQTMGIIFHDDNLLSMAISSATPQGIIVIGTICTVLAFVSTILPPRAILTTLFVGFALGMVAWIIIYFQLATASPDSFPVSWDLFMGNNSYEGRIALAKSLGMATNPNPNIVTLAGLIMGFWIFYGYYIPTFFAGEVKQPQRTLLLGSWASLLFTWAIFVVATLLLQRLVSPEWISAESYLYQMKYQGQTMPYIIFYAAILKPSFILIGIVALGWVYTLINLVQTYFYYCSRILLAWAGDGLMPEIVAYIHPKLRSPLIATLIIAIIAQLGLVDAAQGGVIGAQLNFVFFAVCAQLIPVIAITFYPFLKKEWYKASAKIVQYRIGPIPVITIMGIITLIYLLWLVVSSFVYPVVAGPIKLTSLLTLALFFLSGAGWFYLRVIYLKRKGTDVLAAFKSLPQEN
jgi:APA family basic amino acid/polyamine antiporter